MKKRPTRELRESRSSRLEPAFLTVGAAPAEVRILLSGSFEDRADALSTLPAALVRALLVPSVGLGHAEDATEVALALKTAQGGLERLVAAYLDLDRHAFFGGFSEEG